MQVTEMTATANPRLRVPLRLRPDPRPAPPEMWLLRDEAEDRLAALVADCDDRLLERLQFAVVRHGERTVVLLLGRLERGQPPVFVGSAEAFVAVQQFPNLFAPHGLTLKPLLRRDVMRREFADDPQAITWLESAADGSVRAHRLPRSAFGPLGAAVEHIVEVSPRALLAVRPNPPFSFSDFQTRDELKRRNPVADDLCESETVTVAPFASMAPDIVVVRGTVPAAPVAPPVAPPLEIPELPAIPDAELRQRLAERQREFLALTGPPDAPERLALWPELAALHAAVGQPADAAICWLNGLWESDSPPPSWLLGWLRSEQRAAGRALDAQRIDEVLAWQQLTEDDLRQVAAGLIAAQYLAPNPALAARANELSVLLEEADGMLPVRAAWLARLGLTGLHGGDALALARTRDRLLQQLLDNGLSRDRDLPAFLRHGDAGGGAASAVDRQRLAVLHRKARAWGQQGDDAGFIDLTFAYGFAQLRESAAAEGLLTAATERFRDATRSRQWLLRAYSHRVRKCLDGVAPGGPLPGPLLAELSSFGTSDADFVNLRRRVSRVLEPFERIDPFRRYRYFRDDTIGRELADLPAVSDANDLAKRLARLRVAATHPRARLRVLGAALSFAPRLGDAFATEVLSELQSALKTVAGDSDTAQAVEVLETALLLAAHVGRDEFIAPLVGQLRELLTPVHGERLAWLLAPLGGRLFRTLGKLGLHDDVDALVNGLFAQMLEGLTLAELRKRPAVNWPIVTRALLQIAGGWYYVGREQEATELVDEARTRLWAQTFRPEDQTELAITYATILGQAPPEVAWPRIHELFDKLNRLQKFDLWNEAFGLCEMRTIEAAMLSVVAKDFASSSAVRRWLDEDEYLVRQRIHRDMREALSHSSP